MLFFMYSFIFSSSFLYRLYSGHMQWQAGERSLQFLHGVFMLSPSVRLNALLACIFAFVAKSKPSASFNRFVVSLFKFVRRLYKFAINAILCHKNRANLPAIKATFFHFDSPFILISTEQSAKMLAIYLACLARFSIFSAVGSAPAALRKS